MSNVYVCLMFMSVLCLQSTYCLCLCLYICLIYADKLGKCWTRVALFQFSGSLNKLCDVIQFSLNSFSRSFSSIPPPFLGEEIERQDPILIKLTRTEIKSLSFPSNISIKLFFVIRIRSFYILKNMI